MEKNSLKKSFFHKHTIKLYPFLATTSTHLSPKLYPLPSLDDAIQQPEHQNLGQFWLNIIRGKQLKKKK